MQRVLSGLEVLQRQAWAPLRGLSVGLVAHPASVDASFRSAADLFAEAPDVKLAALFGPEHGFLGVEQDLVAVRGHATWRGVPCHSLYGETVTSLRPSAGQLRGLDALVIDLQDIGSRYYTFQATMLYCMEAASLHGLRTVVLDRPNPLGGEIVEGPALQPGFESFVGRTQLPMRHALTLGELALLAKEQLRIPGELEVVGMKGWQRSMLFHDTGRTWVLPSPNMPRWETALLYPGQVLLEGTC